jgi:hypothetical protein
MHMPRRPPNCTVLLGKSQTRESGERHNVLWLCGQVNHLALIVLSSDGNHLERYSDTAKLATPLTIRAYLRVIGGQHLGKAAELLGIPPLQSRCEQDLVHRRQVAGSDRVARSWVKQCASEHRQQQSTQAKWQSSHLVFSHLAPLGWMQDGEAAAEA